MTSRDLFVGFDCIGKWEEMQANRRPAREVQILCQRDRDTICDRKGDSDFFSDCFERSPERKTLTTP